MHFAMRSENNFEIFSIFILLSSLCENNDDDDVNRETKLFMNLIIELLIERIKIKKLIKKKYLVAKIKSF